jgi:hypothetical protein
VACALLKELHFLEDTQGVDVALHFLRTKRGDEIDFLVMVDNKPKTMIEVKWSDDSLNKNFFLFEKYFPKIAKLQLVAKISKEKTIDHMTEIRSAANWLSEINLKG